MRSFTTLSNEQICYFSIIPSPSSTSPSAQNHFSDETPCCSPTLSEGPVSPAHPNNPLLAGQASSPTYPSSLMSLMQRQTAASCSPPSRPRLQDVPHLTSGESTGSGQSDSSCSIDSGVSFMDVARCSRCQRTPSLDLHTGKCNMIQYGLNLWYCRRCAGMVGFNQR